MFLWQILLIISFAISTTSPEPGNKQTIVESFFPEIPAIAEEYGLDADELTRNITLTLDSFSTIGIPPEQILNPVKGSEAQSKIVIRLREQPRPANELGARNFDVLIQPPNLANTLISTSLRRIGDDIRLHHNIDWYLSPVETNGRLGVIGEQFFIDNEVEPYREPISLYSKFNFPAMGGTSKDAYNKSFFIKFNKRTPEGEIAQRNQLTYNHCLDASEDTIRMRHEAQDMPQRSHQTPANAVEFPKDFDFDISPGIVEWFAQAGRTFDLRNFFPANTDDVDYLEVYNGNLFPVPRNSTN